MIDEKVLANINAMLVVHPNVVRHRQRMACRITRDLVLGDATPTLTRLGAVIELPLHPSRGK